jgi:DNA polymerase II small subunit
MLEIVAKFAEHGYQIEPDALDLLTRSPGRPDELVERVCRGLGSEVVVVSASLVASSLNGGGSSGVAHEAAPQFGLGLGYAQSIVRRVEKEFATRDHPEASRSTESVSIGLTNRPSTPLASSFELPTKRPPSADTKSLERLQQGLQGHCAEIGLQRVTPEDFQEEDDRCDVEVICDITGRSTCVGEYADFVRYFRDRYSKLKDLLCKRVSSRPIESLGQNTLGRDVTLIGMVMDIKSTNKGHKVVELEDPTGMVSVLFQKDSPAFDQCQHLVTDEVVGITGTSDGGGRIYAKSVVWPDLSASGEPLTEGSGGALLLSDLHIGSKYFMRDAWDRFISWISCEEEDPTGLASGVRYLVIAGDLVDGIGVYPGQEADLAVKDIYEQYSIAAELLREVPSSINMIISPGNHDIVRQAEPQPALPDEIKRLFDPSVTFVGNPASVSLGGITSLVYHGRSIDDLVLKIPGLSYKEPEKAMVEMLRRRHLSPIYGNRVSIAPEVEDHYVIQRIPSILHCGHVHIVGVTRYKGVLAINSGTWQSQTDFQKKMNIFPTPAIIPHIDLSTMKARRLRFA